MKEFYFLELKKEEQASSRERNKTFYHVILACEYLCNRVDEWDQETKKKNCDIE